MHAARNRSKTNCLLLELKLIGPVADRVACEAIACALLKRAGFAWG